jgi:hypothetical protein
MSALSSLGKWVAKNGKKLEGLSKYENAGRKIAGDAFDDVVGAAKTAGESVKGAASSAASAVKNAPATLKKEAEKLPYDYDMIKHKLGKLSDREKVLTGGAAAAAGAGVAGAGFAAGRATDDEDDRPRKKRRPYMD